MRQTALTPLPQSPARQDLDLVRDEPRRLALTGLETATLVMTIGATEDGAPLVEIPGLGAIDIQPLLVQTLKEGQRYHFNIWDLSHTALLIKGTLVLANSIRPSGAAFETIFLEDFGQPYGARKVLVLSPAQYAALAAPEPDSIYVVR